MVPATQRLRRVIAPGLAAVTAVALVAVLAPAPALAQPAIELGAAADFAVLAATTVTNTGPTVVQTDLGVSPGSAVTGFPPGVVEGDVHAADSTSAQARADLIDAYDAAAAPDAVTIPTELGGETITPGTYDSASGTFEITGELVLDAQGVDDAVFIFQTASTLVTASGSSVVYINGASPCNVYWQVGSSATLGTGSDFLGNILALTSITVTTGVDVTGRLLARNGAVTMDTNTITELPVCAAAPPDVSPPPPGPNAPNLPVTGDSTVPMLTAGGVALILLGALLVAFYHRRRLNRSPY